MSNTATLLSGLVQLGGQLAEEHLPDPADVRKVVGAVVHYIESGGSLEPPAEVPTDETATEAEQKAARLEAELAAARGEHQAATETPEQKAARLEAELAQARGGA